MMPRLAGLAVGYIVGVVVVLESGIGGVWGLIPALVGLAVSGYCWRRERNWVATPTWWIAVAALVTGLGTGLWRTSMVAGESADGTLAAMLAEAEDGQAIACRGIVSAEPELRDGGKLDLRLRVEEMRLGDDESPWQPVQAGELSVSVRLYRNASDEEAAHFDRLVHPDTYGDRIEVTSRWRPPRPPQNPGGFDYPAFLRQEGLSGQIRPRARAVTVLAEQRGNPVVALALGVKARFLETYRQVVRDPSSRLAAGTTLGVRRGLEGIEWRGRNIVEAFRHAGVGHVLAVSGLHVSIISVLLYALLAMTGLRPQRFVPVVVIFLILFAILTGARASSVRATIMNAGILIIFCYFRAGLRGAVFSGLAISSLFILLHNPLAVYSAGFLLSFGAVLSLVLLSKPLDELMCAFRGWSLVLGVGWFALMFWVSCTRIALFLNPWFLLFATGSLWLASSLGALLNERQPGAWRFGIDRLPQPVRMFLAAQLAIQIGMMIPLSAWFFGRMPVGGMFVNLIAIPLVGVMVQLAMLTGLLSLIPGIGATLAAPLGSMCTLLGIAFFELAWWGVELFPFPAVPKPSLTWMSGYYVVLAMVIALHRSKSRIQDWLYNFHRRTGAASSLTKLTAWATPIVLTLFGVLIVWPAQPRLKTVQVMVDRGAPKVLLISSQHTAVAINPGGDFFAPRELFETARTLGAVEIDHAIVSGFEADHGYEGMAALATVMPVNTVWVPEIADSAKAMLDATGDDYLATQISKGKRWAKANFAAWGNFAEFAKSSPTTVRPLTDFELNWRNVTVTVLPEPDPLPKRFVTSARTRSVLIERDDGYRWLVVPDGTRETTKLLPRADVLIVGDLSYRGNAFTNWLEDLKSQVQPTQVYLGGELITPQLHQ